MSCKRTNSLLLERVQSVSGEEGSSLVEFAIASLVLFALLFGVIQFAYAFYTYEYVAEASREAARYAIVRGSNSCINTPNLANCNASGAQIQTFVQGLGFPGLNSSNLTVTTTWCAGNASSGSMTWASCSAGTANSPGNAVNVNVTYAFPLGIPFWKNQTVNLSSTAQMAVAQ
jgi:Flp pilus assembly protein TadG